MAPEVLLTRPGDSFSYSKSDVWSVGLILLESLLVGIDIKERKKSHLFLYALC